MLLDEARGGDGHQPVTQEFLGPQLAISTESKAKRDMEVGPSEIDGFGRGMEPKLNLGMFPTQVRQAGEEPALQKRRQRAHVDGPGAALLSKALQRRFQLIEPLTYTGQQ